MSGEGPESIPTSADPRSHRPTKKRALTPVSAHAATVQALFAKPDQDIRIPPSAAALALAKSSRHVPPEIVTNVQGSSAGAGSGEFHVYKASRRREYERLRDMDEQVRREKDQEEFEKDRAEKLLRDEEKTRKNREKREKLKARKAKKGKGGAAGVANANGAVDKAPGGQADSKDGGDETIHYKKSTEQSSLGGDDDEAPAAAKQPVGLVIHDDD